jgi:hypothetical protein
MQKGQKTEDKTCTKLRPGRLGTQMETHNTPSTSSEFIIYSGKTRGRGTSQGRGHEIVIL